MCILFLMISDLFASVSGPDTCVCLCLCADCVEMTPRSPAGNHTVVTRSRWPIKKSFGQISNQSCALRVHHATDCHCFFTALFPFPFSPSYWATGVFSPHMDVHAHEHMQKKRMHAHTHQRSTPYYSLLICRALIETPLSPSCTCIPSLIISQGAFVGRTEGDGGRRRGLPSLLWQATCTSTDLAEFNLAASWCPLPFPSVEKICLEQNTCGSMDLYSLCRGWS